MIIVKLKNIIGGKLMKIKYVHTSSITGAVEILLMVGNLGARPQHGSEQSRYSRHERAITFDKVSCCKGSSVKNVVRYHQQLRIYLLTK